MTLTLDLVLYIVAFICSSSQRWASAPATSTSWLSG